MVSFLKPCSIRSFRPATRHATDLTYLSPFLTLCLFVPIQGERKVLNKFIPADFDPKLVPRGKKKGNDDLIPVRMMLPFSIQCSSCSSFMYRGRKFNSKKESVKGERGKYLGIQRFRFYIKCTVCSRPITFLTDPQNADYETVKIMVDGGARVKTRPDDGFTPLHAAAWMGKYDTAKLLLEEGSDVHLAHRNHQGTALHMAVYYGHYDCVRLLLRWGAKVNVRIGTSVEGVDERSVLFDQCIVMLLGVDRMGQGMLVPGMVLN